MADQLKKTLSVEAFFEHNTMLFQVLFDTGKGFNENQSVKSYILNTGEFQTVKFYIPSTDICSIRIDPGNTGGKIILKSISYGFHKWTAKEIAEQFKPLNNITEFSVKQDMLYITMTSGDPCFVFNGDLNRADSSQDPGILFRFMPYFIALFLLFCFLLTCYISPGFMPDLSFSKLFLIILLCYGAVRILTVTMHVPMYGYSDNFDFIRFHSFYGFYPDNGVKGQNLEAPISNYKLTGPINNNYIYFSSEMLFTSIAVKVSLFFNLIFGLPLTNFKIQVLGMVRSIFLIGSGFALTFLFFRKSVLGGFISAAIFSLFASDPVNTLFFNTLYSEPSAFIFSYLSMGLVLYIILFNQWNYRITLILSACLFMLGLSKFQLFLLPPCLAAGLGILHRITAEDRIKKTLLIKHITILLIAGFFAISLQILQMRRPYSDYMRLVRASNLTNAFLEGFLPLMENREKGLQILGLSENCAEYIGKNWWSPGMSSLPCPEVMKISRLKAFSLLTAEPSMLYKIAKKFFPATRPWIYLPHTEGYKGNIDWIFLSHIYGCGSDSDWFYFPDIQGYAGNKKWVCVSCLNIHKGGHLNFQFPLLHWSIAHYIDQLPMPVYTGLFAFSGFVLLLSCFLIFFAKKQNIRNIIILILLLGLQWTYIVFSSVFGDGFLIVNRHFYLGAAPWLICSLVSVFLVIIYISQINSKSQIPNHKSQINFQI
ncbi:MAG: hypothetical protein GY749_14925 [Desulfobacteraceae bacterium]|nr:hypothetical protein [Desulfobacteraceae bacterium]